MTEKADDPFDDEVFAFDFSGMQDTPEGYFDVARVRRDLADGSAYERDDWGTQYRSLVLLVLLYDEGRRRATQLANRLRWNRARLHEPLRKLRDEGSVEVTKGPKGDVYAVSAAGRAKYLNQSD